MSDLTDRLRASAEMLQTGSRAQLDLRCAVNEIERLLLEVINRNQRALDGDGYLVACRKYQADIEKVTSERDRWKTAADMFEAEIGLLRATASEEVIRRQEGLSSKVEELRQALVQIKTLHGILPICASCKQIRDEQGHWSPVDVMSAIIRTRSSAMVCVLCA